MHDDEQQAFDDIFAAQVDLSHSRRAAAMDHTELGETVLLNAQQPRGYTAPAALHSASSARWWRSTRRQPKTLEVK
jgi:hypothetical protein